MGCCSGRCTLAFICGMQLVSVKIAIDPSRGWLNGQINQGKENVFLFKFFLKRSTIKNHDRESDRTHFCLHDQTQSRVWVGRWREKGK